MKPSEQRHAKTCIFLRTTHSLPVRLSVYPSVSRPTPQVNSFGTSGPFFRLKVAASPISTVLIKADCGPANGSPWGAVLDLFFSQCKQ